MGKWLQTKVLAHVNSLSSNHPSINSYQHLTHGLALPDAKAAAFLLQNKPAKIASTLGINNDKRTGSALKSCRDSLKKKIDSRCDGGVKLYTKRVNIAEAMKEHNNLVHGHEEPDDNSTFIFDGLKLSSIVYAPALIGNNKHKAAALAYASEKHRGLGMKDQEYVELLNKFCNTKKTMKEIWEKKAAWQQSFQPTATHISGSALLVKGLSDKNSEAFLAYANIFFHEKQMMDANLQVLYYDNDITPQSADLEEYERYPETEERLRFEALREEMEGVTAKDDLARHRRKQAAAHRYIAERNKTLYLMAKAWLNPDHEASKIMLSQIKSKVDAEDEKRKKKNERKNKSSRKRRKEKKADADIDDELVEKAFGLLKQQIVKFV